ncbi:M48 family peptidase [Pararobbsia alpina]|uniref:M48 family metallopeptidase n=1 Tax=Pararobbsia alpina TaxID=621374 RepID=UPI0039A6C457
MKRRDDTGLSSHTGREPGVAGGMGLSDRVGRRVMRWLERRIESSVERRCSGRIGPRHILQRIVQVGLVATAIAVAAVAYRSAHAAEAPAQVDSRDPTGELRVGNPMAMRGTTTDAMLEQIAGIEYRQLMADAALQHRVLSPSDPRVRRVRGIVDALTPYALKWNDRARRWNWEVNVVRSPRLDAYCMPGGKVVVFTGLFDKLRPSDDELAMLMGHEIAHALRQHARVMLDERTLSRYRGTLSAPQLFGFSDFDFDTGTGFPDLRYSADDEREADVIGTEIAARAGYDPRAAMTLWQRVATIDRRMPVELAESHPITNARLDDLRRRQSDMFVIYAKSLGKGTGKVPAAQSAPTVTSKANSAER